MTREGDAQRSRCEHPGCLRRRSGQQAAAPPHPAELPAPPRTACLRVILRPSMATTVHKYGLLSSLIDIVDEEWAKETLPDDGEAVACWPARFRSVGSRLPSPPCYADAELTAAAERLGGCSLTACTSHAQFSMPVVPGRFR